MNTFLLKEINIFEGFHNKIGFPVSLLKTLLDNSDDDLLLVCFNDILCNLSF